MTKDEALKPLTDGKWYWVRYEGLDKTYEAPALYKESAKAFYSVEFSGIPVYQIEVIFEPKKLEQKPVAWMSEENDCIFFDKDKPNPMDYDFWTPLYTKQQQHKPLTDVQIEECLHHVDQDGIGLFAFARAIESAHGIK